MLVAAWPLFIESVKYDEQQSGSNVDGIVVLARPWYPEKAHEDRNKETYRTCIDIKKVLGASQGLIARDELREETDLKPRSVKGKLREQIESEIGQEFDPNTQSIIERIVVFPQFSRYKACFSANSDRLCNAPKGIRSHMLRPLLERALARAPNTYS